jgi:hypothetical protein
VNESPTTLPRSRRWLVAQATAVLESAAAQNYVRYGSRGVPVYLPVEVPPLPVHAAALDLALAVRSPRGKVRLECPDLHLKSQDSSERQTVWSGYDPIRHLQTIWVWDFHRILSHIALRVDLPDEDAPAGDAWQDTLDAMRALRPGDVIALDVRSRSGNMHQEHRLASAAVEWSPVS